MTTYMKWRIKKLPLYDYKCPKCGHEDEELVQPGFTEDIKCVKCGGTMTREFPTNVSFRMTDNFIVGRERPDRATLEKLESFKENPSKDPYAKFRDKK